MKIKIFIDSGANIHSRNDDLIDIAELGAPLEPMTALRWSQLDECSKAEAVRQYWLEQGLPEIGFEEIND